jgi:hypothetical protein
MASKGLMTSGIHWGLSCEAQDEAQMGVILGYMTLLGAKNIAWAPLNRPPKRRAADPDAPKNPNMATGAAKAAATRKKNSGDRRKPAEAVGAEFLASHHGDFTASQINAAFEKASGRWSTGVLARPSARMTLASRRSYAASAASAS